MKSKSFMIEVVRSTRVKSLRRQIVLYSLFALLFSPFTSLRTLACGGDSWGPSMSDYFCLVQPLDPDVTGVDAVAESVDFWYDYLNGSLSKEALKEAVENATSADYDNPEESENALVAALYKRGNTNALTYLKLNNRLYKLNTWMHSWDYERPTDGQYHQLVYDIARLQNDGKLDERIVYLRMRALYCGKRYDDVEANWQQFASKWKESPLKRRARGYLGGVYYQREQYVEALEIFDANGDMQSINKCVSRLLNPDKLTELYEKKKDSRVLGYVIQDYANYLYHALSSEDEWGTIWPQVKRDYNKMLTLAERVVKEKKVKDLALWQDFVGFLYFAVHDDDKAYEVFGKVANMKATQEEKNFARYFRFLASFNSSNRPSDFTTYLLTETENLLKTNTQESADDENTYNASPAFAICTFELPTRLYKYCGSLGNEHAQMLVLSIFGDVYGVDDKYFLNFSELSDHTWSADKVIEFYNKLKTPATDPLIAGLTKLSPQELTPTIQELIGTKLMREGNFDKAVTYLEGLPMSLLKEQGIAPYLNLRTFSKRDFERENYRYEDSDDITEYRNVKLEFCRDMAAKMRLLPTLHGNQLSDLAYELANKCFQASPAGDLWALSEYSWSSVDIHYNNLNKLAIEYLRLAIQNTTDMQRLKKCYYGLAAVPQEETTKYYYNWDTKTYVFDLQGSELEGYDWLAKNLPPTDELRRSCDYINAYIASR